MHERSPSLGVLNEEIARLLGLNFGALAHDVSHLQRIRELAATFAVAIAPRRLATLLKDQDTFRARVTTFMARRTLTDAQIQDHARQFITQMQGMTSEDANRFVRQVPASRLRTYPDDQLCTIASHFVTWDPLIRFLDPEIRSTDGVTEEPRFNALLRELKARLQRNWPNPVGGYSTEDAVQDAIKYALRSVKDPQQGYIYEGDFVSWLAMTAINQLRGHQRTTRKDIPLPECDILPSPGPLSEAAYRELIQQWQERYLLVESFFRDSARVKAIWTAMLHEEEATDADLANVIEQETSKKISPDTVAGIRRRLRQRLDVLRFILDEVSESEKDAPGDVSVLERILYKWGLAPKDVPTLRHLAALARAAHGEKTLGWALLSRFLIDRKKSWDEVEKTVLPLLEPTSHLNTNSKNKVDIACTWSQQQSYVQTVTKLRNETKRNRVGFFLSPCWYLAILRSLPVADAIQILRPTQQEEAWITTIVNALACDGSRRKSNER